MADKINHPDHYGGKDNIYEAIKVIEAWRLGFSLGNCIKYIARAGNKITPHNDSAGRAKLVAKLEDLQKAQWYLTREIENTQLELKERLPA